MQGASLLFVVPAWEHSHCDLRSNSFICLFFQLVNYEHLLYIVILKKNLVILILARCILVTTPLSCLLKLAYDYLYKDKVFKVF